MRDIANVDLDSDDSGSILESGLCCEWENKDGSGMQTELGEENEELISEFYRRNSEPPTDEPVQEQFDFEYPAPRTEGLDHPSMPDATWFTNFLVSFSYTVKFFFARLRHILQLYGWEKCKGNVESEKYKNFVPLFSGPDPLFIRNIYRQGSDVCNRPVASVPGTLMTVRDRFTPDYGWTFEYKGTESRVLNMGSYNYLGFAQNRGPCAEAARRAIDQHGVSACTPSFNFRHNKVHKQLDALIAEYLGVEAAMCFPMGYGTNAMNIPAIVGKGSLILSDQLNHASLVTGCRLSGALVKVFKHNDVNDLERKLIQAIAEGDRTTGRPYKKILIVMEGIYSMEGTISPLPQVVALKKKYKAYLFLDEAHSIGALGETGKGCSEYFGCDPTDIDVMMGTLTKSFAAAGGYLAGTKKLIDAIRTRSHDIHYGTWMAAPVAAQVLSSMHIIMNKDGAGEGKLRIRQLLRNTRYFRRSLAQRGFLLYGHEDSPVVPLMTFFCTRTLIFCRETLRRNLAVVGVCYPATPLTKCRARFCISAAHTKEQLDWAIQVVCDVGEYAQCNYGVVGTNETKIEY